MNKYPTFKFLLNETLYTDCEGTDLTPEMFLPTQANETDSGWDVRVANKEGVVLIPGCYVKIDLGFKVFSPDGWWMDLRPRSSTFTKRNLNCLYGTIDQAYAGPMMFAAQYCPDACKLLGTEPIRLDFGEKVAQLLPVERKQMNIKTVDKDEFDRLCQDRNSTRGAGGFGSSGNR